MPKHRIISLLLALLLPAAGSSAGMGSRQTAAVRVARAPRIDGILNDSTWSSATPETVFLQRDPQEGAPASERTEVRVLYDDRALYVGCTMYDSDPSGIVARLARRDDETESDAFSVCIDSYHDLQTAFEFTVNAAGVKVDILQYDDGRQEDVSWDAVWEAETQVTSFGWVAEIAIPFAVLRFAEASSHTWGIQFIRTISRKQETQHWMLIGKNESGFVSRFGTLTGIENIPSPRHIEILPYVLGSRNSGPAISGPQRAHSEASAGLDVKFRPLPELTVDATINPDFGQVEVDPAVLNLSTFETFYPERRPFFTEGAQIFRFQTFGGDAGGLFYSRRIGRALETDAPAGGRIIEKPGFSTIMGAVKASGRTSGGLSFGILEALTQRESAVLEDSTGYRYEEILEPLANYNVVRLRQDIFENSNVGFAATSVGREDRAPAFTGGSDWNLTFLDNTYRIDGFLAASVTGGGGAGRRHGTAGRLSLSKEGGAHWLGSLSGDFTSRRFDINDIGYFRRPNDHGFNVDIGYRENDVTSLSRFWVVEVSRHGRWNFEGAELYNSVGLFSEIVLLNYWSIHAEAQYDRGRYDDRETRGNGLYRKPESTEFEVSVESDPRSPVVGELRLGGGKDSYGSSVWEADAEAELRPVPSVTLEFELFHTGRDRQKAWVETIEDPLVAPAPFNVFADRSTREWNFTARGSFVFTRDLSLQCYVQWFLAKGTYERPERMISESVFAPFPRDVPDFTARELHSNVVLRWEYLPGSILYLVWSHARSDDGGYFRAPFGKEFGRVFDTVPSNVVLLKISYWLSP